MLIVREETKTLATRDDTLQRATESAIIPGLGQLRQGRYVAAIAQFGTVVAYLIAAGSLGGTRAMLFALFWNVWSIIDAARYGRAELQTVDPVREESRLPTVETKNDDSARHGARL